MGLFSRLIKTQVVPHVEAGSYWVCCVEKGDINAHSIFAKVLHVGDGKVHYIRRQNYGFLDLKPNSLSIEEFLRYYVRLED